MAISDLVNIKERAEVYLILMEEIRARLELIDCLLKAPWPISSKTDALFHPGLKRELCYLQFRYICEIIALAVTAAHGDLRRAKALRASYKPAEIFKALKSINEEFYPRPVKMLTSDKGKEIKFLPLDGTLLSEDLIKLWSISGDFVHRAPMAKALKKLRPADSDFSDITFWKRKCIALLNQHWVAIGNNQHLMVSLLTNNGHAQASMITISGQEMRVNNFSVE